MSARARARLFNTQQSSANSSVITPAIFKTLASTGVTPQAVLFDGSVSTTSTNTDASSDLFGQLRYQWNFGETTGETWNTGASKDTDEGPIAAHAYKTAGTFTVTLTATLGNPWQTNTSASLSIYDVGTLVTQGGNTYRCAIAHTAGTFATDLAASRWTQVGSGLYQSTAQTTVVVADISAANTICVNSSGTSDGIVPGVTTYMTASNFNSTQTASTVNGKRVMVRQGQGLTVSIPNMTGTQAAVFDTYGTGSQPSAGTNVDQYHDGTGYVVVRGFTVAATGSGTTVNYEGKFNANCANVLFMNCAVSIGRGDVLFGFGTTGTNDYNSYHRIFLVECSGVGANANDVCNYGAIGSARYFAMLGCGPFANIRYHDFRSGGLLQSVVAHNSFPGDIIPGNDIIKIHADDTGIVTYPGTPRPNTTNKVVIRDNDVGSSTTPAAWYISPCPEDDFKQEGIENILIEDNRTVPGPSIIKDVATGGRDMRIRRNVRTVSGTWATEGGHTVTASGFNNVRIHQG